MVVDDLASPPKLVSVVIRREGYSDSFGFGMGTDANDGAHVITNVGEHTPADGVVFAGDELREVNGINVRAVSHESVKDMLKQALELRLVVARDTFAEEVDR